MVCNCAMDKMGATGKTGGKGLLWPFQPMMYLSACPRDATEHRPWGKLLCIIVPVELGQKCLVAFSSRVFQYILLQNQPDVIVEMKPWNRLGSILNSLKIFKKEYCYSESFQVFWVLLYSGFFSIAFTTMSISLIYCKRALLNLLHSKGSAFKKGCCLSFLCSYRFSAFTQNSWHSSWLSSSVSFKIAAASFMGTLDSSQELLSCLERFSLVHLHNQSAWNTKILCFGFTSYNNACIFSEAQLFEGDFHPRRSVILCEWPVLCWVLLEQHLLGSEGCCSEKSFSFPVSFSFSIFPFFPLFF